jgi:hypothetical protein
VCMAVAVITMTISATPAAEATAQSTDCICGPFHNLADSTAAVVCRLMRRVRVSVSVSVSVSSNRLLWRCRGAVVWVSSTPMPSLMLLLLMRVRVPGAIRHLLWWFIRHLAGTGIKVDYQLPNVCILLLHRHLPKLYKETTIKLSACMQCKVGIYVATKRGLYVHSQRLEL